jgi:hypothetical protein
MAKSPKKNEETIQKALSALRGLAPDVKFGNKGLAELETQSEKSMIPRRRLVEIENERAEQIAMRDTEDGKTLMLIDKIVGGVINHDDYGDDSALYEAFGFVRKSQRKSGLTRKKKEIVAPTT